MEKHDDRSDSRIDKPQRRRFRMFRVSFLILLAALTAWISRYYFARPTIKVDYVQKLNDLTRPADYDPNDNAAPLYEKAFAALNEMPEYRYKVTYDPNMYAKLRARYMEGIDPRYMEGMYGPSGIPIIWSISWPDWPGDIDPNNLRVLEQWIRSNEESLRYIKQATQKPYYWVEQWARNSKMYELSRRRSREFFELQNLLSWQVKMQASQDESQQAFDNFLLILAMAEHLKRQALYQEQACALDMALSAYEDLLLILFRSSTDVRILEKMQKILEAKKLDTTISLQAERFYMEDLLQRTFTDNGRGNGHFLPRQYNTIKERIHPTYADDGFDPLDIDSWRYLFRYGWNRDEKNERSQLGFCLFGEDRKATQARADKLLALWKEMNEQPFYWPDKASHLQRVGSIYSSKDNLFIQTFFRFYTYEASYSITRALMVREAVISVLALLRYKAEYTNQYIV